MAAWEAVVIEDALCPLLRQLTENPSTWDFNESEDSAPLPRQLASIRDVELARNVCPRWRDVIDNSAQWAAIRLARWDYA